MRKFLRDNILGILGTMRDGIMYAGNVNESVNESAASTVVVDCVDALVSVMKALENNLSEARFGQYAGCLNLVLEGVSYLDGTVEDAELKRKRAAELCRELDTVENMLKKEPEVLKEIVFFPYKASMFDAMWSVWKAALEDPGCVVSVVPIPYYERKADGSQPEFRFEGLQFPEGVPVADWEKYDLSVMKPDIAYIHNAYDGNNFVTSVHPRFYTTELKKHVGTLVYVPYFVSSSPAGDSFTATAAHSSVDIIVASSEDDKRAYLEQKPRAEVVALGSPKVDRILSLAAERSELPETWGKLRGKKIFFLNTSVGSLLRYNKQYFLKLANLFDIFAKRNDIGLIWRPHPLTQATISSMRPQLQSVYNKLETTVRSSAFGVLDDTPDMETAIAVSDAYLGDGGSSLVYLYALTGRPMYILNFKMPITPPEDELRELEISDFFRSLLIEGDRAWGFSSNVNALCHIDLNTGEGRLVSSVPGARNARGFFGGGQYGTPVRVGKKLLLPPTLAREWAVFDPEADSWEKIPIPPEAMPGLAHRTAFGAGISFKNHVIFIPGDSGALARYDIETSKFSYYTDWFRKMEPYVTNHDLGLFSDCFCIVGDALFLASMQANIVAEINMNSLQVTLHRVGDARNRYYGIAYCAGRFWMTKFRKWGAPWREGIVCWNRSKKEAVEYNGLPLASNQDYEGSGYYQIYAVGDSVYVFPLCADRILKVNAMNGEIRGLNVTLSVDLRQRKSPYHNLWDDVAFAAGVQTLPDGRLITSVLHDYCLYFLDPKTGVSEMRKLKIDGIADLLKSTERMIPYTYLENAFITAERFIGLMTSGQISAFDTEQATYARAINVNSDGSCGRKVHEHAMAKNKKARL